MMRYDKYTLNSVTEWLELNGCPHDISYLDYECRIYYRSEILFTDNEYDDWRYDEREYEYAEDALDALFGKYGDCADC